MMDANIGYEAECAVIGAVVEHGAEAYDAAVQHVDADSFADVLHQSLWAACERIIVQGGHVGIVDLMDAMKGGADIDWPHVQGLALGALSPRSVGRHAQIVAAHAKSRALTQAARDVQDIVSYDDDSVEQRVARSVAALEKVVDVRSKQEALPVESFAADFLAHLTDLADGKIVPGRPTHIPTLDKLFSGGLRDGQLVVVAARPSVGKSSFAQQIALTHATGGTVSGFFGMEMTSRELTNRTVANLGHVALGNLKTGQLLPSDWPRVAEGVERLRSLPLYLYDQPAMTLAEVASKARLLVRRYGLKTLVVDYLQLMKGSNDRSDRRVQLEEITRGLKQLAKQLGITIILLSQLNRAVEQRTNPRPMMSDLKECGAIEEDADIVLALWTHSKGEGDAGDVKGCAVLKNRDGATGEVALHFNGPYQQWTESTVSLVAAKSSGGASKSRYSSEEF